jgi:peroxiredoxin
MLPKYTPQVVKKHQLSFPVLSDPGNQVARTFGLVFTFPDYLRKVYLESGLDIPRYNGDDSWQLPLPARYVIDRAGIVRSAEANPDYTVRPEPEATLAILERLAEP